MLKFKNIAILVFVLFLISSLFAQSDSFFYFYRNQRIELFPLKDQLTVEFKKEISRNRMQDVLQKHLVGFKIGNPAWEKRMPLIHLTSPVSESQLLNLIEELKNDSEIAMVTPVFRRLNSRVRQTINRTFIVRFQENVSLQTINQLNQAVGAEIVKTLLENTFLLRMKIESKWNGLQAANYYSELPEVKYAQPNFIYLNWETLNYDVNDPLWPQQWAHKNTGQSVVTASKDNTLPDYVNGYPDADIDADQAWDVLLNHGLSAGGSPDILVAFLDSGVDLDHPDLAGNLFSPGVDYTPDNGSDANDVQGHGTSTAGIVAAQGDNGLGVAGIAFRSQILPLKVFTLYGSAEDAGYAEAMDYAWQHGADVISNSWSGTSPSQVLEDAIQRAKTQGRNGKGCVVVFSSGNGGSGHVSYPGYLDNVIAVGASNMFDEKKNPGSKDYQRSWGGNYGTALDLVAPTIVYTTDIAGTSGYVDGDYFDHFGGTSAACPHVSGVAALVLAADSNLTAVQVQDILQRSADKIDLYPFDENGWNEHVGYGRVNAYKAVKLAFGENGDAPVISHTVLQSTSSVDAQTVSAVITDNDGLATGNNQPALYYRAIFQGDTSAWHKIIDEDGPVGNQYDFVIPAQSWGNLIEYYIVATDNALEPIQNTFPFKGDLLDRPPKFLKYHVGDFASQVYNSSDVPVNINDDNIFFSSTLNIPDDRQIVDVNMTLTITGFINDLAVALESPAGVATGPVSHNGDGQSEYQNTNLDDEASTPIYQGSSPFSGTFKPDNGLFYFDGLNARGNWTLKAFDDTYYNNNSTIESWNLEITYLKPINPPIVSDIPDQTIAEGQSFTQFDLDDYVTDADNSDAEINWTYSGNQDLIVTIDAVTHVATIQPPDENWNGSEVITFIATDPTLLSDSDSAKFTVTPVNDPPVVSDIPDQTIDEGQSFATFDLDDYVSDVDNSDAEINWTYSGNSQLGVNIDPTTHVCTVTVPNSDWNGSETITFTATDPGGLSDSDPATFTVNPVNDPPVVSDIPDQTIDEGQSFATFDLDDYVSDVDNSDSEINWTYSGSSQLVVNIDPTTHVCTVTVPNSDWNGSETITFTATDPGGLSDSDPATFTVNPVNDPPVVSDIPDQTIDEGQSFSQIVLDNYVSDPDNADSEISWTYSGNKNLTVTIDENRVATISPPDSNWNGAETITFTATDPGGLSDADTARFTVNPVNDPPRITSTPDTIAIQDQLYQYQVVAVDVDSNETLTYSLLTAPSFLSIDANSGLISGTPGNDDVGVHPVSVQVKDSQNATDQQDYNLTVKNQNDPPVVSDIPDQTIDEGQSFSQIVLDNYVSDPDNADNEISWTYSGNKDLKVTIDENRVATISPPDSNWNGAETITFTATDPGGLSDSDPATFTVNPVNDPPVVSDIPDQTIDEGQSFATFDLDDYVSDVDNSDSEINWTYSGNSQLGVTIDPTTHVCTVTVPNSDWNGSETITFTATDPGGLSDSDPATFTVNPINDPPVVSDIPDQTIDEGQSFSQIILDNYVSDPDNADSEISWTYSGNKDLKVTIDENRVATISPPDSNWNGAETITFTATDPGGLSDSDTARFTVNPVNDPPRITSTPDTIAIQDQLYQYQVVAVDVDSNETLTYSLLTAPSFLSIDANSGLISGTPGNDDVGVHPVSVQVKDSQNATDQQDYNLTVKNQNDPPVVSDIPDQTIDEGQSFSQIVLDNYVSDPDNADSEISWTYSGNKDLTVTIDENRVATISPPDSNWNGAETITFTATDPGGLSDSDTARFTVNPVNDPPKITSTPDTIAIQDQLYQYQVVAVDVDSNETLTYSLLTAPSFLSIDANSGLISGTPGNDDVGVHPVSVQVKDSQNATDQQDYNLTVKNQNDPPVVSDIPDQTIDEGQSFSQIVLDNYVSDPDNADSEISWTYSGNKDLKVTIDENRVATISPPDSNWNGAETITFTATDPGGLSDSDTARFTVNPVNDPPRITSTPDTIAIQDQLYQYQVVAVDVDSNETLTYSLLTAPSFLSIDANSGLISGTPGNDDVGVHPVSVQVKDSQNATDQQDYNLTVKNENDPPVVSDIPDQTIDEGQSFSQIVLDNYVSDPDNADSEISWTYSGNKNLTVTIDENRVATISPPDSNWNGAETITFTATDPAGLSDSDTARFTVNPVNDSPRITSTPDTIAIQDQLYQYQVVAEDVDSNETLTYSLLTAPSFLSIDANSGLISGSPGNDDVGVHPVSVQVKDSQNATDQQDYNLTVKNQNDPPVVSDIPDQTIDEGQSFSQIALDNYVSDPDNADSEISWTYSGNKDLMVTIDENRVATISPPDSNWNGAETITFTATDPGDLSDADTARFTVNSVEDPPVFNAQPEGLTFFEDDSLFVPFSYWFPFVYDPDTPDSMLNYQLNDGKNVHSVNRNNGNLLFAEPDWFGQDSLVLKVNDSIHEDSAFVAITVLPVNDPPQIVGFPDTLSFYQGDSLKLQLTGFAKDIDTPLEKLYWQFNLSDSLVGLLYDSSDQELILFTNSFKGQQWLFAKLFDDSGAFDFDSSLVIVKDTLTSIGKDALNPLTYQLFQNFPNPFNPGTTIRFTLKQRAFVKFEFFDLRGRRVLKSIEQVFNAGENQLRVRAASLPTGIYFYRMTVLREGKSVFSKIKKMVLLK